LATTPYFYTFDRDIVKKIESLELKNGGRATVLAPRAKYQMGGEILWSPLYGKDSVGLKSIIRSDTFLKFGVHNIWYSKGEGLRFHLGLGKTFFLTQWLGARLTLSANYYQKIWNEVKSWSTITMVEFGTVIYF
jgi:outer membrane beta-barrel protein